MIHLVAIAPQICNLNGDQGNLLALRNYLVAAGFKVQLEAVELGAPIPQGHFSLLGHASDAGMALLGPWLDEALQEPTGGLRLAVGSGALYTFARSETAINRVERVSQFEVTEFEGIDVLGYRNSDTNAPALLRVQSTLLTMLHGPVLAKNPALLDRIARQTVVFAGLDWPREEPDKLKSLRADLLRICSAIWLLEADRELPVI